eukprot:Opistho-2@3210
MSAHGDRVRKISHERPEHVHFPDEVSKSIDDDATHDVHGAHHDEPNTVNFGLVSIHHIYSTTYLHPKAGVLVSASTHPELKVANDHSGERHAHATAINIEITTHREGRFAASFQVARLNDITTIHVVATVMGKNKGTPALRPGIHCVGRDPTADSEYESDFKGFHEKP